MFNNLKYGQGELTTPYMYVGGLVGANQNNNGIGSVENCYVTGTQLQVIDAAGELIGVNWGNVTNSYTAANGLSYYEVYSPSYGEAIYPTYMSRNMYYAAGTVTGVHYDASSSVSLPGTGTAHSSRSELKQQDTFEGWDFENIWTLDPKATEENGGFPVFGTDEGGGEGPDKPGGGDEKPENPGGGDKNPGGDGNPGSGQPSGGNTAGNGFTSNGSDAKGEGSLPTTGDPLMLGPAVCISAGALSLVGAAYWRRRHRA